MKEKYYVNIANGAISKQQTESEGAFTIYADEGDIERIKERMASMDSANLGTYVRSHVPFYYPIDSAPENSRYDRNLKELYAILHELGDEHTRGHIESIDILNEPGEGLY